jgi:diguanylate cyclase (GGDEF)-like protein/PAS domain S-box-containing protein
MSKFAGPGTADAAGAVGAGRSKGLQVERAASPDAADAIPNTGRSAGEAQRDVLTGLPSRPLLADRIGQTIALSRRHLQRFAVLFLHLDGLGQLTDSLGLAQGDRLLQSIARCLVDCVRGSDTVSREGGDEFIVLLSEVEQSADAAITARRMLRALNDTYCLEHPDKPVITSIGVSVYSEDGLDAATLIENARTAMFQAKATGRESYQFFTPAIHHRAVERQFIEEGLRQALERQEFVLHYLPRIDLRTGEITAAEAVIFWRHPTRGSVPPTQFIPVAERSGTILQIGKWVLGQACKQARAWVSAGLPSVTMAVSISAEELRDEDFLDGVLAILRDTGMDPRFLELEVTENILRKHGVSSESILRTLSEKGIGLVVAHFGTDYSNIRTLGQVSIDTLKIDQTFIYQLAMAPEETTIAEAMIDTCRNLGLRIVAEGVETPEQLAFLQSHHCDEAQGPYLSPPLYPEQFERLLEVGVSNKVVAGLASTPPHGARGNSPARRRATPAPGGMESINIDGAQYQEGSAAHLAKLQRMHRAEIDKQSQGHFEELAERRDVEDRSRRLNEKLEMGLRARTAALADGKLLDATTATFQSEARFRMLVNGVKEYALFLLDPGGAVTSWNSGAERIMGYTEEEIVGKHISVFYEPAEVASGHEQKILASALRSGRSEEEGRRVRKDGSTFWAGVVVTPIHDFVGGLLGFAKITHDLTERRNLEDQLRQSQKMEAIGMLAGGVAHDFNNLLSAVLSYSEMLAEDLQEGDPMREGLNEITGAGLRAVALTRQLLAFSRQQTLEAKIVDLTEIVVGMEAMLRRLIGEDVELIASCAPVLTKVLVDPGQIEQVIMNLALNARDAMPRGGRVTIETADVILDERFASEHEGVKPGPHVMLAVTDTGSGMDKATQSRIFEPFFTTKGQGKGTGLGLATVFGVIKQSGGTIWVYSELEKGTAFKVYLPVAGSPEQMGLLMPSPPAPDARRLRGYETILLVDDDPSVRVMTRAILRKYGYNVLEAEGGGDAFLLCEQHPATIHLLLTDVVMPRMNGRQLAERLLLVRPEMKVLYMSGYTDDSVMRHGILESTLAFIQKPITPQALARKVREVLGPVGWSERDQRA